MTNAKTFLEKRYSEEMALEDAIHTALLTLKEGFEGQVGQRGGGEGGDEGKCVGVDGWVGHWVLWLCMAHRAKGRQHGDT
jgi:hypothetical protein